MKKLLSGILLCFCSWQISAQPSAPQITVSTIEWLPIYPQVKVNGNPSDDLHTFISHREQIFVQSTTLHTLGIQIPPEILQQAQQAEGMPAELNIAGYISNQQQPWLNLNSIPELEVKYDSTKQTLDIVAPLTWLNLPSSKIGQPTEQAYDVAQPSFAGVFNYDYNLARADGGDLTHGLLTEMRFTTPIGYLSHNQLFNHYKPKVGKAHSENTRLDTYWRTVWSEQGLAFTAGDLLTNPSGISGGSRIGGIKLEHTYSVQPWRNINPLRSYIGQTTLPSTVDLYVNGVKQYSQDINAGAYEIILPPIISGSGMAQVVTTDILGRTVVVDMPLYGGTGMLDKGLAEWSLETGYLRKGYGLTSSDYDKQLVGSGFLRYGLSPYLTAQIDAEGGGGYRRFGIAASTIIGSLGQLNLNHAQSRFKNHTGQYNSAFFSTQRKSWSFGLGWSSADHAFTHLSSILNPENYQPKPFKNRTVSASVGWYGSKLGALNLSYLYHKNGQEIPNKIGTLGWNYNINRYTKIFINATKNFNKNQQNSIYGGLSIDLDKNYYMNLSAQRDSDKNISYNLGLSRASHGLNSPAWGISWQHQDSPYYGRTNHLNGYLNYDTQYGDARFNIYNSPNHSTNWNAGWQGSLVLMKGGLFSSRHINNSFAVVSTNGVPNVPVALSNNHIGHTNRKGLLLVPNLLAHQPNYLTIDITNLAQNLQAERNKVKAIPSEHSGVAVDFQLKTLQAASLHLKNHDGQFVKHGSVIYNHLDKPTAVVGFDGQTFIENLSTGNNHFTVMSPDDPHQCRFTLNYQLSENTGGLPNLGEIKCIK